MGEQKKSTSAQGSDQHSRMLIPRLDCPIVADSYAVGLGAHSLPESDRLGETRSFNFRARIDSVEPS